MNPLLYTVIVISITIIASFLLLKLLKKLQATQETHFGAQIHIKFLFNIARLFVILVAFATIGSQFSGFNKAITTILASSGILALGISLAAQESLTNIIDGLFISMFKPFNIGDKICLPEKNNLTGKVSEMNLRHTVITTYSNTSYIVPNSIMSSAIIDNNNFRNNFFSYPIDVSVSYESDLKLAMKLMEQAVAEHPDFVDIRSEDEHSSGKPAAVVLVRNFGDSGIDLRVPMRCANVELSFKACSDVRIRIKELFDENGIVIPYTTIHIDS